MSDMFVIDDEDHLSYLLESGLLWFLNTVLHPFGMAISVEIDGESRVPSGIHLMSTNDPDGIVFHDQQHRGGRQKFIDWFVRQD